MSPLVLACMEAFHAGFRNSLEKTAARPGVSRVKDIVSRVLKGPGRRLRQIKPKPRKATGLFPYREVPMPPPSDWILVSPGQEIRIPKEWIT